jgi:putative heme transporter
MSAMSGGKRASTVVQIALAAAIVIAVFAAVIPRIADYRSVGGTLARMSGAGVIVVVAVALLNLVTYWVQSVAALPGLTLGMAAIQTQTTTTIANTVPAGGGVAVGMSVAMLRSWGYTEGDVARFTLITGVWNTYVKLGLPVVALGLLALEGRVNRQLAAGAAIGVLALAISVVLLALVLWRERFAERIGRALDRPVAWVGRRLHRRGRLDIAAAAVRFRSDTVDLLGSRWHWLTLATILSHLSLFAVLLVSLRVVGISQADVSWIDALAAFSFARLVTALPVTPGGVGVVELSYIGTLIWAGGARTDVVAAVLLFRAATYFLQIPLGAVTYPVWQRTKDSWRRTDQRRRRDGTRGRRAHAAA